MGLPPTTIPPMTPQELITAQLSLLSEYGNDLRARSQPEYLYTAASLGAFGAVSWGVAAMSPTVYVSSDWWARPPIVAAAGIFVVAVSVLAKIWREHTNYGMVKAYRAAVANGLAAVPELKPLIAGTYTNRIAGRGAHVSGGMVILAGVSSIAFCLSVRGPTGDGQPHAASSSMAAGPTMSCVLLQQTDAARLMCPDHAAISPVTQPNVAPLTPGDGRPKHQMKGKPPPSTRCAASTGNASPP